MKKQLIQQALTQALTLQESDLTTQAIKMYKNILKEDEHNFEAYFELGNCYTKINDYMNALLYFKKAIKVNNQCHLCHFHMSKIYDKLGKYEFSLFHLEKVIKLCGDFHEALFLMAQCYRKMKNEEKMLEYLHKTLKSSPQHPGANHLLASHNQESSSEYCSEYAEDLFDRYAEHFEDHLVDSLKYKVPSLIRETLKSLNPPKNSRVLDLGCGTGLLGKTIIDLFPNLVGVDISTNMIAQTRKKEIYSSLHIDSIDAFLFKNEKEFDLIIVADVFIYIGDIETVFTSVKNCLSSNGYFIFSIELSTETQVEDFQLRKSGRFSHTTEYIDSLCADFGFDLIHKDEVILREENRIGQKGVIYTLKISE